jgi:hypothetical protein
MVRVFCKGWACQGEGGSLLHSLARYSCGALLLLSELKPVLPVAVSKRLDKLL